MLFTQVALSALTLSPFLGAFAWSRADIDLVRRGAVSVASTFSTAQSKMDTLLSQVGTGPVSDHSVAGSFISAVSDVSTVLAADMDSFNPGIDILMVDLDGTKLTDEQLGDKVVTVAKDFEKACSLVKDLGSGDLADVMQTIALNTELVGDDLARVLPNIAKLPNVVEGTKNAQDSILAMIDSMLGPELQDD